MPGIPESESAWIIHSINIHGAFFEEWCREAVRASGRWHLPYYNYPVNWAGQDSALDLRADLRAGNRLLTLLIECKKNNPELTEWVFFVKRGTRQDQPSSWYALNLIPDAASNWLVTAEFNPFYWLSQIVDDGRETRGNYLQVKNSDSKTKTANQAIQSAARQISLAYRAITTEETTTDRLPKLNYEALSGHYRLQIYMPIIVTTARLRLCEFEPSDVDPRTGELPLDKAKLREVTHLRYEYPLPPALQWQPLTRLGPLVRSSADWREPYIRQSIVVVGAAYFRDFLSHLAANPGSMQMLDTPVVV